MSFDNNLSRLSSSESVASPLRKKSVLALANTKETVETLIVRISKDDNSFSFLISSIYAYV